MSVIELGSDVLLIAVHAGDLFTAVDDEVGTCWIDLILAKDALLAPHAT